MAPSIHDPDSRVPTWVPYVQNNIGYLLSHTTFPSSYGYNINSNYTIYGLNIGQRLDIQFYVFNVESGHTDCRFDFLEIIGVADASEPGNIIKYCNRQGFQPRIHQNLSFTVIRPRVMFSFKTGRNEARDGFFFKYAGETMFGKCVK